MNEDTTSRRQTDTITVAAPPDAADLHDPLTGRTLSPSTVTLALTRFHDPGRPAWELASVTVTGPRRLKSGRAGQAIDSGGWHVAVNAPVITDGRQERPEWLTTLLAGILPAGWSPAVLGLPDTGSDGFDAELAREMEARRQVADHLAASDLPRFAPGEDPQLVAKVVRAVDARIVRHGPSAAYGALGPADAAPQPVRATAILPALLALGLASDDAERLVAQHDAGIRGTTLDVWATVITASCPEHSDISDSDEVWAACHCDVAEQMSRGAALDRAAITGIEPGEEVAP